MSSCFVVMAIGDQYDWHQNLIVSQADLKSKYDALIKEAILSVNPNLEIIRADESSSQGMISTDIINRLMFSDFVVVDITYPNPNVFYELGLRHACNAAGTIIIKDKESKSVPFDISHLRYIEYSNTPAGLLELKERLKSTFFEYAKNPNVCDSQFQEQAKLTNFQFPTYEKQEDVQAKVISAMIDSPELIDLFAEQDPHTAKILKALGKMQNGKEIIGLMANGFGKN
jgi:hypothetical protein